MESAALIHKQMMERVLCVVDRTLRKEFPDDFHKRCMYSAFGIHTLLRELGHRPILVGGDFAAFVLSRDGRRASVQGYSSQGRSVESSHYWVELEGTVVDLGTSYLPVESSFPAAAMPATHWDLSFPLPKALQYRPEIQYDPEVELRSSAEITDRMDKFLDLCKKRNEGSLVNSKFDSWLLRDPSSLAGAAKRGDLWAAGAIRFEGMS